MDTINILIVIGLTLISFGWFKNKYKCPPPIVEFRYIPRTFKEEQNEPVNMDDLLYDMFRKRNPWIGGYSLENELERTKRNEGK